MGRHKMRRPEPCRQRHLGSMHPVPAVAEVAGRNRGIRMYERASSAPPCAARRGWDKQTPGRRFNKNAAQLASSGNIS
jgi:hypothetical protein